MRRETVLAGLSGALVALATLLQMYIDWRQSGAEGLEHVSLKLKLAVIAATVLTLTALVLGLLPTLNTVKQGRSSGTIANSLSEG